MHGYRLLSFCGILENRFIDLVSLMFFGGGLMMNIVIRTFLLFNLEIYCRIICLIISNIRLISLSN